MHRKMFHGWLCEIIPIYIKKGETTQQLVVSNDEESYTLRLTWSDEYGYNQEKFLELMIIIKFTDAQRNELIRWILKKVGHIIHPQEPI